MSPGQLRWSTWAGCYVGKSHFFGGLVAGGGRRYSCSPAALFLSGAAGRLCSCCSLQAEGASPRGWLFWATLCRVRERSMVCATKTWEPEEWMWFASLRWKIWSGGDSSSIPGKFVRFGTFFPILCHNAKEILTTFFFLQRDKQKEVWDSPQVLFKCVWEILFWILS